MGSSQRSSQRGRSGNHFTQRGNKWSRSCSSWNPARGHTVGSSVCGLKSRHSKVAADAAFANVAVNELEQDIAQRGVRLREGAVRVRHALQRASAAVGPAPFGVYTFYDYDGHAMYVGKTSEGISVRVRRHLTNQRTDAVAMSVLDPLEVVEVEVWPLWPADDLQREEARTFIGSLEYAVEQECVAHGDRLFNEKKIPPVDDPPALPASVRFDVLSPENRARLGHPDLRIARRSAVSARLASRIVERSLKNVGLRLSLHRQLERLTELAESRFQGLGGEAAVEEDTGEDE
jgi:hypothetical protein